MGVKTFTRVQGPYNGTLRAHHSLSWKSFVWSLTSNGNMATENHYPLNTDSDDGGPWLMSKSEDTCSPGTRNDSLFRGQFTVGGHRYNQPMLSSSGHKSDLQLQGLGTTAIARCAPNNPSVSLPTLMGEIGREGIPAIIGQNSLKERTRIAKSGGGEYLNIEFGWKPLVSDLRSLARTVNESARIWSDYRKGSGQKTRVGYHFPSENDQWWITDDHLPIPLQFPGGFLSGTTTQQRKRETWFSGCFRYYIHDPVGFSDKMSYWHSQASKLYGLRLTPDIVWNLSPWTWATDWFANTGDLLTNVSNLGTDALALQYGYMMDSEEIRTYTVASWNGVATSRTRLQKRAKRIPATPYGFNATLSTLTNRQLAIIAALGLTKGNR